jgi:spoIIIJ-associated protein
MEWVETTGKTVEEAVEIALDQLGVDAADAEYEVLEEPKTGLFGRLRAEARVRARVRPTTPRPKDDRRTRGRKAPAAASEDTAAEGSVATERRPPRATTGGRTPTRAPLGDERRAQQEREPRVSDPEQDLPIREQGEMAAAFVRGVVDRFGAPEASVTVVDVDDETVEVRVEGLDLGLLIGPKGAALQSLQDLARTVVQRQTGARSGRILVDVAGYRARRKEALERFARKIADDVLSTTTRVVLEPMNPADRKVIHDTINGIEGVSTSSEGEEPRRRVVVSPA